MKNKIFKRFSLRKKLILLLLLGFLATTLALADYHITRGPDIGEIYFIGPTATTEEGLYHSIDFGETATCMDSLLHTNWDLMSISADLTPGVIYGYSMPENLYISYNYGQYASWIFRAPNCSYNLESGRNEGEIFCSPYRSSEDYGFNFVQHYCLGVGEYIIDFELDSEELVGYAITYDTTNDSINLYKTYDNFDNCFIKHKFGLNDYSFEISGGTIDGELFIFAKSLKEIYYTEDGGNMFRYINTFHNNGLDFTDLIGGRQEGEVYLLATYISGLSIDKHIYIFHSTDNGQTFEVFHPFSYGEEPLVANFSTTQTDSIVPVTVQFCNYSIGDIQTYEWDFNNDGIIDSNEPEPEYTYQDTGYYSVKLTVYDTDESDEFLRENYIHVKDPNAIDEGEEHLGIILNNTPNPFRSSIVIHYTLPHTIREAQIEIYNIKGQKIKMLIDNELMKEGNHDIIWDGTDSSNKPVGFGIYFIKLETEKYVNVKKIIKLGM